MKQKKIMSKLAIALVLPIFVFNIIGCQDTVSLKSSSNSPVIEKTPPNTSPSPIKQEQPVPTVTVSPTPQVIADNKDVKTQQTGSSDTPQSPIPFPTATPNLIPTTGTPSTPPGPTPTIDPTIPRPRYDINRTVPDNARDGVIDLVFKDEAIVRYYGNKNIFISKANFDVSNINNLVKKYNALVYGFDMSKVASEEQTEIQYEKDDRDREARWGYEVPNGLSLYNLYVVNINVKELIEAIRKESTVLSCNYVGPEITID